MFEEFLLCKDWFQRRIGQIDLEITGQSAFFTNLYKIITKVLSFHLNEVLGDTILENQSAFVVGRQILDDALIANEVVDEIRSLVFKLDFEKAYHRVS